MVSKHNVKMDNMLQENGKLCREFDKKQVNEELSPTTSHYFSCTDNLLSLFSFFFYFVFLTQSSRRFRSMLEQRRNLPAWQEKGNILGLLDQCQVLVVSGMTG